MNSHIHMSNLGKSLFSWMRPQRAALILSLIFFLPHCGDTNCKSSMNIASLCILIFFGTYCTHIYNYEVVSDIVSYDEPCYCILEVIPFQTNIAHLRRSTKGQMAGACLPCLDDLLCPSTRGECSGRDIYVNPRGYERELIFTSRGTSLANEFALAGSIYNSFHYYSTPR
jgi:hypothetical protein